MQNQKHTQAFGEGRPDPRTSTLKAGRDVPRAGLPLGLAPPWTQSTGIGLTQALPFPAYKPAGHATPRNPVSSASFPVVSRSQTWEPGPERLSAGPKSHSQGVWPGSEAPEPMFFPGRVLPSYGLNYFLRNSHGR